VPSIVPLFVLATGFAVGYIVTESLWVPVVMHALFNGMNIGLLLLTTSH
jgi:membrane protease YdiL (CAAX protease family)